MTWNSIDQVRGIVEEISTMMLAHGAPPKLLAVSINSYHEIVGLFKKHYGIAEATGAKVTPRTSPFCGTLFGIPMVVRHDIPDGRIAAFPSGTYSYYGMLSHLN